MNAAPIQSVKNQVKVDILDNALNLFAKKGFDGASTREIADAAGVTHALIKYHFGSKEELWKEAVNQLFGRLDEVIAEFELKAADIDDPVEWLRLFISHYIRYCAEHPEHARIMVQESTSENNRLSWAVEKHMVHTSTAFEENVTMLIDRGDLPKISKISFRYIFTAACQSIFTLAAEVKLLYGTSRSYEQQIEAHIDAVTKLLLRD